MRSRIRAGASIAAAACLVIAACSSSQHPAGTPPSAAARSSMTASAASGGRSTSAPATRNLTARNLTAHTSPPHTSPAHVVVVVEENHSYRDIVGNPGAPYVGSLADQGTSLTHYFAVSHPSEPNYLALFSGSAQHLTDDSCPHHYSGANLGSELRAAHRTFTGYSEGLPNAGYTGCAAGRYVRRHAPWVDFSNLPAGVNQPVTAFPTDYSRLPTLSFVIPNLDHDMHDGTIAQADTWLRQHLDRYVRWAATHDSILVVTWDEDDHSQSNQVPTIVTGAGVRHGTYAGHADLYRLLRTFEWLYGLPLGVAASRTPITALRTR